MRTRARAVSYSDPDEFKNAMKFLIVLALLILGLILFGANDSRHDVPEDDLADPANPAGWW